MKPNLHIIGFPHTKVTQEFMTCAYTQKIFKFCKMMKGYDYKVNLYAPSDTTAEVNDFVDILSDEERERWCGPYSRGMLPGYMTFFGDDKDWTRFKDRASDAIKARSEPGDLIVTFGGPIWSSLIDIHPECKVLEGGIGYPGTFADYRIWESYSWMHCSYGMDGQGDGGWADVVIPNYFDTDDFIYQEKKEDYLLFVGRLIYRKGVVEADAISKASGRKLLIAGPGVISYIPGERLIGNGFTIEGDNFEYIGVLDVPTRAEVMGKAHALLAPTRYIEPFGGVTIEANMCGTPAITTDWGAFAETIINGWNGQRIRSVEEGLAALDLPWSPYLIRQHAEDFYSLPVVGAQYDNYFQKISK